LTHRNATIAALIAVACLGLVTVAAAGVAAIRGERHQEAAQHRADDRAQASSDVITYTGIADIRFGARATDLTTEHGLRPDVGGCVMRFGDIEGVDPVFADDRLVLMWIHAPVHTPEGIMEGSSVAAVRQAYSGEVELTPPAGSHAYPGILVRSDDRAYLFPHDGQAVRKVIAGYADYVQRLYTSGFNAC
jgi:hypothetical protein